MLTVERIRTRRTTGEVRSCRCKRGQNCAVGGDHGSLGDEFAAAKVTAAPFCLLVRAGIGLHCPQSGADGPPVWKMSAEIIALSRFARPECRLRLTCQRPEAPGGAGRTRWATGGSPKVCGPGAVLRSKIRDRGTSGSTVTPSRVPPNWLLWEISGNKRLRSYPHSSSAL